MDPRNVITKNTTVSGMRKQATAMRPESSAGELPMPSHPAPDRRQMMNLYAGSAKDLKGANMGDNISFLVNAEVEGVRKDYSNKNVISYELKINDISGLKKIKGNKA